MSVISRDIRTKKKDNNKKKSDKPNIIINKIKKLLNRNKPIVTKDYTPEIASATEMGPIPEDTKRKRYKDVTAPHRNIRGEKVRVEDRPVKKRPKKKMVNPARGFRAGGKLGIDNSGQKLVAGLWNTAPLHTLDLILQGGDPNNPSGLKPGDWEKHFKSKTKRRKRRKG